MLCEMFVYRPRMNTSRFSRPALTPLKVSSVHTLLETIKERFESKCAAIEVSSHRMIELEGKRRTLLHIDRHEPRSLQRIVHACSQATLLHIDKHEPHS